MKGKAIVLSLLIAALAFLPSAAAAAQQGGHVTGTYIESRTADVYTGPCFANSEVNVTGQEAVLAWHVEKGTWGNVPIDGLNVTAVVRAGATLGDVFSNPLPAKAALIVDDRATDAQREALVNFAHAQAGMLLDNIVNVQSARIRFTMDPAHHGYATLEAGNLARITTRAIMESDSICHNEEVFYEPLASNLTHAMPAVASLASYTGDQLGATWTDSNRRSAFVGNFSF
jgi:hypothetical protein